MNKGRETSTDKDYGDGGEFSDPGSIRKPNWVSLAQLDGPANGSLVNKLLYKPALRFHGLSGGIWSSDGLSGTPSIISDRPPSYRFSESVASKSRLGPLSAGDTGSLYNTNTHMSRALSPLTLRRRNTIAVILVAIALLAAVAVLTGLILHFLNPRAMLRANVRMTIANRNYTDDMGNTSTIDYDEIASPLCSEMDRYYLTSELADFYLGCKVKSLRKSEYDNKPGLGVHFTLDFTDNKVTNDESRIKNIIMKKSGREKSDGNLYLVVRDFLVYLRSLRVDLERIPYDVPTKNRPRIPWSDDIDFIARLPKSNNFSDITEMKDILKQLVNSVFNMTAKIDTMQNAIDFINKTFHETHQPLFRLEDTLENMTISLDNLNFNLDNINKTLNSFKAFLKQFDNTVFNIDDIIKHLDDAVNNLGQTVTYVTSSMSDFNGTMTNVHGKLIDIDTTLLHINQSVFDVNGTAVYTNKTLESMDNTLKNLEDAVFGLNVKLENVVDGMDVINISLANINDTVRNSLQKLFKLHANLKNLNGTVSNVERTMKRLNATYSRINDTLSSMNEPVIFTNGTVLEIIQQLTQMDHKLADIVGNILVMNNNMTTMNSSLEDSMSWLEDMLVTLKTFDELLEKNNNTINLSLKNIDLIETVGVLLKMNGTLAGLGEDVDKINVNLDGMEKKLGGLDNSLHNLEDTLANINTSFIMLNKTLKTVNTTMYTMSKSIEAMNNTVDQINGTFANLNDTFNSIERTLDAVNKTLLTVNETASEINQTSNQVNETLRKINETIDRMSNSTSRLRQTINNMEGPMPDLLNHLHNANESLRMVKAKTDIIAESYKMLQETITGMDTTIDELLGKLAETKDSLRRTNNSLGNVNISINAIEGSHDEIGRKLADMQASFTEMNSSFSGIGSAFPNLMKTIQATQSKMTDLKNEMDKVKLNLDVNDNKRDLSQGRYTKLSRIYDSVFDTVSKLRSGLDVVKHLSSDVNSSINDLQDNVTKTDIDYIHVDKNIKYLNTTFDNIKDKYERLGKTSMETNTQLDIINSSLSKIISIISNETDMLRSYRNLDVSIDQLNTNVLKHLSQFNDSRKYFDEWTQNFSDVDNVLWDNYGNPISVTDPFDLLKNNTEMVNTTLNGYKDALEQTIMTIGNIDDFDKEMRRIFEKINKTKLKIDDISSTKDSLNDVISNMTSTIDEGNVNVTDVYQRLTNLLEKLEGMKNGFGDINGTYNTSNKYSNLDKMILKTSNALKSLKDKFSRSKNVFKDALKNYTDGLNRYNQSIIILDNESNQLLDETIDVMKITNITLGGVETMFDDVISFAIEINKTIDKILGNTNQLQDNLEERKKKNNYITSNRPVILNRLNITEASLNASHANLTSLLETLKALINTSKIIKGRSDLHPIVNVSLLEENQYLNKSSSALTELGHRILAAFKAINDTQQDFDAFTESNSSLAEIEEAYGIYKQSINAVADTLKYINTKSGEIDSNYTSLSTTFTDILRMLKHFENTTANWKTLAESVTKMNTDVEGVGSKLDVAINDLERIEELLTSLKQNYTNFTATDIDISESYVHEAVKDIRNILVNLTELHDDVTFRSNEITSKYGETNTTLADTLFDRNNIDSELHKLQYVNHDLDMKVKMIGNTLSTINNKIKTIDMSLTGLNETLHITNEQLFKDRQKKLLADTKFPSLEEEKQNLEESLATTENLTDTAMEKLNDVMKIYNELNNRLDLYPSVNISLEADGMVLQQLNETIHDIFETIKISKADLNNINDTMWTSNGERYTANETLSDIKNRYQKAANKMKELDDIIETMEVTLLESQNNSIIINEKLTKLNSSLNEFDTINHKVSDVFENMKDINKSVNESETLLTSVEINLKTLDNKLEQTKQRFSQINQSVYDDNIKPFEESMRERKEEFDQLREEMGHAVAILKESQQILNSANGTKHKTVIDQKELDNVLMNVKIANANITTLIEKINLLLDGVQNNSILLDNELVIMDSELDKINDIFRRQEKEEYFEKHYPIDNFDLMKNSILNTNQLNNNIGIKLNTLMDALNNTEDTMNGMDKINISMSVLKNDNIVMNTTLNNNTAVVKDLNEKLHLLKQYLNAHDGTPVSDAETIEEMKDRYKYMNTVLKELNDTTNVINENLNKNISSTIVTNQLEIDHIDSLLHAFTEKQKEMNNFKLTVNSQTGTLVNNYKMNTAINSTVNSTKDKLRSLKIKFESVHSDAINSTWNDTTNNVNDIISTLDIIGLNISSGNAYLTKANDILNEYFKATDNTATTSEGIQTILSQFEDTEIVLENIVNTTEQLIQNVKNNSDKRDNDIKKIDSNVEVLEKLLLEQEKKDYIQSNSPVMEKLLKHIQKNIGVLNDTFNGIHEISIMTNESFNRAKEAIDTEPSIDILLHEIGKTLLSANENITDHKDEIEKLKKLLRELDVSVIDSTGVYFKPNDTIDIIKETFHVFNATLNNVTVLIDQLATNVNPLDKHLNEKKNYLDDLYTSSVDFTESTTNATKTLHKVDDIEKNVKGLEDKLKKLEKDIKHLTTTTDRIKHLYNDVKNATLRDKLDTSTTELKTMNKMFKAIQNDVLSIKNASTNALTDRTILADLLDNSTTSLEDLMHNVQAINTVNNDLADAVNLLNQSTIRALSNVDDAENLTNKLNKTLNDLEDLFRQQEIDEFLQENVPLLQERLNLVTDNVNVANKSIRELHEKKRVLQNLYTLASNIIHSEPTLNISLDGVEENMSLSNDDLIQSYTYILDIKGSVDSLDKNMLNEDGTFFKDNDMIDFIKTMFKKFNETLDTVNDNTQDLSKRLHPVNQRTIDDTEYLNDLLTVHENMTLLKEETGTSIDDVDVLNKNKNVVALLLNNLNIYIDTINSTITNIEQRYNNVNDAVLQKRLTQKIEEFVDIKNSSTKLHDEFITLNGEINNTVDNKTVLEEMLQNMSSSLDQLRNQISNIVPVKNSTDEHVQSQGDSLSKISMTLDLTINATDYLNGSITVLQEDFRKQEIKDFIDRHVPGMSYLLTNLNHDMKMLNINISNIKEKLIGANESYYKAKDVIDTEQSINIPIESTKGSIRITEIQIDGNNKEITLMSDILNNMDLDIINPNGTYFKPNDSIENVVKTLINLNDTLTNVVVKAGDVELALHPINNTIEIDNDYLNSVINATKEFTALKNATGTTIDQVGELSEYKDNVDLMLNKLGQSVDSIDSTLTTIGQRYDNVNDDELHQRLAHNNKELTVVKTNFKKLQNEFIKVNNDMNKTLNNKTAIKEMLQNISSSLVQLRDKTSNIISVKKSIDENVQTQNASLTKIDMKLELTTNVADQLNETVTDLLEEFRKQEIKEFIDQHVPGMAYLLNNLNKDLNMLNGSINRIEEISKETSESFYKAKDLMEKEPTIKIPLSSTDNSIRVTDFNINENNNGIISMANILNNMDFDIINPNGTYFKPNESIQNVVETLRNFNDTLNNEHIRADSIKNALQPINKTIENDNNYLNSLIESSGEFSAIKDKINSTIDNVNALNNDLGIVEQMLSVIDSNIYNLNATLFQMQVQYKDVKNKSLRHLLDFKQDEINNIKHQYEIINNDFESLNNNVSTTLDNKNMLEDLLKNISISLEQLTERISKAKLLKNETDTQVRQQDSTTSDLTLKLETTDEAILNLNTSIAELEERFRQQQIDEYIKDNSPYLQNLVQTLNLSIPRIHENVQTLQDQSQTANNSYFTTQERLDSETTLQIPLDTIKESIKSTHDSIMDQDKATRRIQNEFSDIDMNAINNTRKYINETANIDTIVELYDNINNTLNDLLNNSENITVNINQLGEQIKSYGSYLDDLHTEANLYATVRKQANQTIYDAILSENNVHRLQQASKDIGSGLNSINRTLVDISDAFTEVRNKDLQKELLIAKDSVIDILESHDNITKNITELIKTMNKTTTDANKLQESIENIVLSIDQLRNKTFSLNTDKNKINRNVGAINLSITDIDTQLKPMENITLLINNTANRLKEKFKEQQIKEFITDNAPVLQERHKRLHNDINSVNKILTVLKGDVEVVNKTYTKTEAKLKHEPTTVINISEIDNNTTKTENARKIMTKEVDETKVLLSSMDTDVINETGSYFRPDATINEIKQAYTGFKTTLDKAESTIKAVDEKLIPITEQINTNIGYLNSLFNNSDIYQNLKDNITDANSTIEMLNNELNDMHSISNKIKTYIDAINSSLLNMEEKYSDTSNRDLHAERDSIESLLNTTDNVYQNIINDLSNVTEDMNNTLNNREQLAKGLSKIADSLDSLINKIREVVPENNVLNVYRDRLNSSIPELSSKLQKEHDKLASLNQTSNNLEEKLRKQQIVDYIKKNFPSVLNKYETVNKSLSNLNNKFKQSIDGLDTVRDKLTNVDANLSNNTAINIPFDDKRSKYKQINESLQAEVMDKNKMLNLFADLEDAISGSKDTTFESLDAIKERFKLYNDTLIELEKNATNSFDKLTKLNNDSSQLNKVLTMYNSELARYDTNTRDIKTTKQQMSEFNNLVNTAMEKMKSQNTTNKLINGAFDFIKGRFKYVNSSALHERFNKLNNASSDEESLFKTVVESININDKKLQDLEASIKDVKDKLISNITDIETLSKILDNTENFIVKANEKLTDMKPTHDENVNTLDNINKTSKQIQADSKALIEDFTEKEKLDFIAATLPIVHDDYKMKTVDVGNNNNTQTNVVDKLKTLNATVSNLNERIANMSNIQIPTNEITANIDKMYNNVAFSQKRLENTTTTLNGINESLFHNTDWSNYTLSSFNDSLNDVIESLNKIGSNVYALNNSHTEMKSNFSNTDLEVEDINSVLNRYDELKRKTNESGEEMSMLLGDLNITETLIESVASNYSSQDDRWNNLTAEFSGTTNDEILKLDKDIQGIVDDTIGLRVPLVDKLFSNRLLGNFNTVQRRFEDVQETMAAKYSSVPVLYNQLDDVTDDLVNVTLEAADMARDAEFYATDSIRLMDLLNKSNDMLDTLEQLYKKQRKQDFLDANIPGMVSRFHELNTEIDNLSNSFNKTNHSLQDVSKFLGDTENILQTLPTVQILTDDRRKEIKDANKSLEILTNNLTSSRENLSNVPLLQLNMSELVLNKTVSFETLKVLMNDIDSQVSNIENVMSLVGIDNLNLKQNVSDTNEKLELLNKTLHCFTKVDNKLNKMNESIKLISKKINKSATGIKLAEEKLDFYNDSLTSLKDKYKKYKYNSTTTDILIDKTLNEIKAITEKHNSAKALVDEIVRDSIDMNERFMSNYSDRHNLNESLAVIKSQHHNTSIEINHANKTIDKLLKDIPTFDITLKSMNDMIQEMNKTLINEERKAEFVDGTLPALEEKYRLANASFDMTNKTLQMMANKMKKLEDYVNSVRNRMNGFETINISMTDADLNITYLENRLIIMQEHYQNVEDVVKTLQKELEESNIFGENISLKDVKHQYEKFNDTLEMISTVLGKIENESYEVDDHFDHLNETVQNVDNSLDIFEEKMIDTSAMKADIQEKDHAISNTNKTISEMMLTLNNLNATFNVMQDQYKDVLETTAENNTDLKNKINDLKESIDTLNNLVSKLSKDNATVFEDFDHMNKSLFSHINTFNELNNTLGNVQDLYNNLSSSIVTLDEEIKKSENESKGLKSSIQDVTTFLDDLNSTLFDEQQKYNFINSNLGNLEAQFNELKSPLEETNRTLEDTTKNVASVIQEMQNLTKKLDIFPTVAINNDANSKLLKEYNETLFNLTNEYAAIEKLYTDIENNLPEVGDRTKSIEKIQSRYNEIKSALENVKQNITSIQQDVKKIKNGTAGISINANKLSESLDAFTKVRNTASNLMKNISVVDDELRDSTALTNETTEGSDELENLLLGMQKDYGIVKDKQMHKNLTEILKELNQQKSKLKDVAKRQNKALQMLNKVKKLSDTSQKYLNRTVDSQEGLDMKVQTAIDTVSQAANETDEIKNNLEEINSESESIRSIIDNLEEQMRQLNDSMFEEKMKIEFVNDNFPGMKERYNILANSLNKSSKSLNVSTEAAASVSKSLKDVKSRLDLFNAIQIPLNTENETQRKVQDELARLAKTFANISDAYSKLDTSKLKDRNNSFQNLQNEYKMFGTGIDDIKAKIKSLEENIDLIINSVVSLNETVKDINSTVDKYEDITKTLEDQTKDSVNAADSLVDTNKTMTNISDELDELELSLQRILSNFSHIKDPPLLKAIESVKKLFINSKGKLESLKGSISQLDNMNNASRADINEINKSLKSTKTILDVLKKHINDSIKTSEGINTRSNIISATQIEANKTTNELSPELKKMLNEISDLSDNFVREQEKLDFIAKHKPLLEQQHKDLAEKLKAANQRISLKEVNLAEISFAIKKTGAKLSKFKTLNMTTDPEMNQWNNMSKIVQVKSGEFIKTSTLYNSINDDINNLNDRKMTKEEMEKKFEKLNDTLKHITHALLDINDNITSVNETSKEVIYTINALNKVMDTFKNIKTDIKSTDELLKKANKTSTELASDATEIKDKTNTVKQKINRMEDKYKPLKNNNWIQSIPKMRQNVNTTQNTVQSANTILEKQRSTINDVVEYFEPVKKNITTNIYKRNNVDDALMKMKTDLTKTLNDLSKTDTPLGEVVGKLPVANKTIIDTDKMLQELDKALNKELEKYTFVNTSLPQVQTKHSDVNATFVKNDPDIQKMKDQMVYLSSIINKIKEKMTIFGLDDTDSSVKKWLNSLQKLNNTATDIVDKNELSRKTLVNLKAKLWSKDPMYSDKETLPELKSRFDGYNKSLDDIAAKTHVINLKLKDVDKETAKVLQEAIQRDAIMTTTPATTTPSGPPEWMNFKSTKTGVIGRDSGEAVCTVGEFTDWELMTITRIQGGGHEEDVAQWDLYGGGTKKLLKDRRISVSKRKVVPAGGEMVYSIKNLQCKDEGTYFCYIDTYSMWPLETNIIVTTPAEDNLEPNFPTEVFEDKLAGFSCSGQVGYPNGKIMWKIQKETDKDFKDFNFYSAKSNKTDTNCVRTETNTVEFQFDMSWNNTKIRCYIENTDYYTQGAIRLLRYDICNNVRYEGLRSHPYTPHKYIICGKELNIMGCPGNLCYDDTAKNCIPCKASQGGGDPCIGKTMYAHVPHESDCKKYYICLGRNKKLKKCPRGYFAPNVRGNCALSYGQSHCATKAG